MLKGTRVVLEEIAPENIEKMRVWRNDPELRQYFREWKDITVDQQEKWYGTRGNNSSQEHIYFQIVDQQSGLVVGCCGLLWINWHLLSAEFSVFIAPEFRHQSLGKEALRLMIDYGFKDVGLNKIWGEVYEFNSSINTYLRLGFKQDGILRDTCLLAGQYRNSYLMSILKNEWN